jgi:hypothetical protein
MAIGNQMIIQVAVFIWQSSFKIIHNRQIDYFQMCITPVPAGVFYELTSLIYCLLSNV